MKVLFLAAGYGTRLERDVTNDTSGKYAHLKGLPKPLIPVGSRPLLSHWLPLLDACAISRAHLYVICNDANLPLLRRWAADAAVPEANVMSDGSTNNDNRCGAIRDIAIAIQRGNIDDDLLILGGDTLYYPSFSLPDVIDYFKKAAGNVVLWYTSVDTKKTGILETAGTKKRGAAAAAFSSSSSSSSASSSSSSDSSAQSHDDDRVVAFLEKPDPSTTASRQACPCFYMIRKADLQLYQRYCDKARTLSEVDAPGQMVSFLVSESSVYARQISGRYDIGGLDSYITANDDFTKLQQQQQQQQQPFVVVAMLEIDPSRIDEFKKLIEHDAVESRKEPGCSRFDVLQPIEADKANHFTLYEVYADEAAFTAHCQTPHFAPFNKFKESGGIKKAQAYKHHGLFVQN